MISSPDVAAAVCGWSRNSDSGAGPHFSTEIAGFIARPAWRRYEVARSAVFPYFDPRRSCRQVARAVVAARGITTTITTRVRAAGIEIRCDEFDSINAACTRAAIPFVVPSCTGLVVGSPIASAAGVPCLPEWRCAESGIRRSPRACACCNTARRGTNTTVSVPFAFFFWEFGDVGVTSFARRQIPGQREMDLRLVRCNAHAAHSYV